MKQLFKKLIVLSVVLLFAYTYIYCVHTDANGLTLKDIHDAKRVICEYNDACRNRDYDASLTYLSEYQQQHLGTDYGRKLIAAGHYYEDLVIAYEPDADAHFSVGFEEKQYIDEVGGKYVCFCTDYTVALSNEASEFYHARKNGERVTHWHFRLVKEKNLGKLSQEVYKISREC